ncbi:MAG: hypothetical protein Q9O74_01035 [Planctomycetota bacterium]|nr:hypothetical protein [Planctomycetota bacterium]
MELVVVLGVVMILSSFLFPGLAGAVSQGKLTRDLALMRSHAASITMYTAESDDVFPFWGGHHDPTLTAGSWYLPMMEAGYFSSREEIEPDLHGSPFDTVVMSMCMVYDRRLMRPGETVPSSEQRSSPVLTRAVSYPSLKGLVFRAYSGPPFDEQTGLQTDVESFCCVDLWEFPVGMADGSAVSGNYLEFNNGKPVLLENEIGTPVWTTWLGVEGIDRW